MCHPGYQYHIQSDDQSIELRSCFEQDPVCINNEYEKINEQKKIIQENRRQYLSKTFIQIIISLSIAIGLTLTISSISFMYLFRKPLSIDSNYSLKTSEK
ncbi:unnamed protein product [Rotaria sp. Silwood1]|nr:unnamed protein product [Rotaria sp. Silwood1]